MSSPGSRPRLLHFETGAVPVGIGGDGSVSLPLMRAAARRHEGLVALHIDSHTDAYPYTPDDRYNAATQFTNAAEEGLVDASSSWHIGVRGFTYCPGVLKHARALGFWVVTIEDLMRRGYPQTIAEFRRRRRRATGLSVLGYGCVRSIRSAGCLHAGMGRPHRP